MTFSEEGFLVQKCPHSSKRKENGLPQALINFEEDLLHKRDILQKHRINKVYDTVNLSMFCFSFSGTNAFKIKFIALQKCSKQEVVINDAGQCRRGNG